MSSQPMAASSEPLARWNVGDVMLSAFVFVGWTAGAIAEPTLFLLLVPWVVLVGACMPVTWSLAGDDFTVRYTFRKVRVPVSEIRSLRIRRFDGRAKVTVRRRSLWFGSIWDPSGVDELADELERRGVRVVRRVMFLVG